jgi:predicted phosphodiesterase
MKCNSLNLYLQNDNHTHLPFFISMLTQTNNIRSRPVFKAGTIDDQFKFQPLPEPTAPYPYHVDIEKIIANPPSSKMVFQLCGDTGGILLPTFQHQVVREMTKQFEEPVPPEDHPLFFFHLGDIVYNYGQVDEYYSQFFDPFRYYPAPIFAIAGNHDADVDPLDIPAPPSLDAFMKVFCDSEPRQIPFAGDTNFKSTIQPNIYWTLKTPLANIICLYGNVPRFGIITKEQKEWFIKELKISADERHEKALIVCVHHPAYSADTNHGSSLLMQIFLNTAFEEARVIPDIVLSGHVHNYQRFIKQYPNGKSVPFIVAGAGGYAQLHSIAQPDDPAFPDDNPLLDNVLLEKYCDHAHGFLKISIEKTNDHFMLNGTYFTIPNPNDTNQQAILYDEFAINLK